jgi:insertion element IS1 protein InsB
MSLPIQVQSQLYHCKSRIRPSRSKWQDMEHVRYSGRCSWRAILPEQVEVELYRADELEVRRGLASELDEMWSYVAKKANPRWLWHAIDHHTGKVLAYVFGRRKDTVFLRLQALLAPFGITRYSTDGWGTYERHVDEAQHVVGKEHMQKIESKHINLRTRLKRLVRRTLCFSKTEQMHDLVIGLFVNRYEFGRAI